MLVHIVRFFQRYAVFFSGIAGSIAYRLVLPDDSNKWLKATVAALVALALWKLLYDDEVTGVRANGEPGLSALAIIGYSVLYWGLILYAMLVTIVLYCGPETEPLALDRCREWGNGLITVSAPIAAIAYAFGMWAAIRARRPSSD